MRNKIILILLGFLVLAVVAGIMLMYTGFLSDISRQMICLRIITTLWIITRFFMILLILLNGTTIHTGLFKMILILIGLLIVDVAFKFMRWPGGAYLTIIPRLGIIIIYSILFIRKEQKKLLDILKLLWVGTFVFLGVFSYLGYGPIGTKYTASMMLLIMFICYILTSLKDRTLFKMENGAVDSSQKTQDLI